MRILVLLTLALTIFSLKSEAGICYSNGTGDWDKPASWSCGRVPTCGDTIYIQAGHTVTLTASVNYHTGCVSVIQGTLHFNNGRKLDLPCNSGVAVMAGGNITHGGGGGVNTLIGICNTNVWTASAGPQAGPVSFGSPLPVELLFFNAKCESGKVRFEWATATELENDYFEIQKSSNGSDFETIAVIPGAGTSSTPINYSYTWSGTGGNYFRLKQTDFDGKSENGPILAVNCNDNDVLIYPNPVHGDGQISVLGKEIREIQISSIDGRFVKSFKIQGENTMIAAEKIGAPGVYLMSVISDFGVKTTRVVVCR